MIARTPRPVSCLAPGPAGLPLIGSAHEMVRDELRFVADTCAEYGPIATVRLGRKRLWFVTGPELIDEVLVRRHTSVVKDEVTGLLKQVVGNGLLTSEGELWRRQRRLAAPALSRKQIDAYAQTMIDCARAYTEGIAPGSHRDLHHDMMAVTLRIVARTLFGSDVSDEVDLVGKSLDASLDQFDLEVHTWRVFVPQYVPTPGRRRLRVARAVLSRVVGRYIDACRARGPGDDLLSMLVAARDEEGAAMDDEQLRDEAITLFVAGHETTALVLTFAQLLLAAESEAAAKLDDELARVLHGRDPTPADVAGLPYTAAVVREAMRVHPPAWIIGREAAEDLPLGGYVVPRGQTILIPIYWIHRRPEYFSDPDRFNPDRWLGDLERTLPKHAYMPFGGGPRICIGNHFALVESVLTLATIRQRLRFRPDPRFELRTRPAVTLRPFGGVPGVMEAAPWGGAGLSPGAAAEPS